MSFTVLTGKALKSGIDKFATTAASFTQAQHQLGYSCLAHVEEHHCASHLNRLFASTPTNYRDALRVWAKAFGKVSFDPAPAEAGAHFAYDAKAKSDLPAAMETGPAEYAKADKTGAAEKALDEVKAFETLLKRFEEKGASARAVELARSAIRALKTPVETAPAAAPAKPRRAKPVLVETAPVAPVEPAQTAMELEAA